MYDRAIAITLGLGATVLVLLLAGFGAGLVSDDPPEVSPYASASTPANGSDTIFVVSAVAFGDAGYIEISNVGDASGSLDGHWLCQFPAYHPITGSLGAGETLRFDASASGFGSLDSATGEIGLYTSNSFDDPSSIIAYVEWGQPDHQRSRTAVEAGVWVTDSAVDAGGAAIIVAVDEVPTSAEGWTTG